MRLFRRLVEVWALEDDVKKWKQQQRKRKKPTTLKPIAQTVAHMVALGWKPYGASRYIARRVATTWLARDKPFVDVFRNDPPLFDPEKKAREAQAALWGPWTDQRVREQKLAERIRTAYYTL